MDTANISLTEYESLTSLKTSSDSRVRGRTRWLAVGCLLLSCIGGVLRPVAAEWNGAGRQGAELPAAPAAAQKRADVGFLQARVSALRRQYGAVSLPVAHALVALADAQRLRKEYTTAEQHLLEAREIIQATRGADDPAVAAVEKKRGNLLVAQGRYLEAQPLYERVLAILREALPAHHPELAAAVNDLGYLHHQMGRFREAGLLYQEALNLWQQAYGPEHRRIAIAANNLAEVYRAQGRYAEAETLYRLALKIDANTVGDLHPAYATGMNNLALLYLAQARYGEAERLLTQSIAILESALQDATPELAMALNNLAETNSAQGRYEEAESLHQRALTVRKVALGGEHPDVAMSLNNLALLYQNQGRLGEAEPLLRQALFLLEKTFGNEHPSVAAPLSNLAEIYEMQGRYADAEPLHRRALAILERTFGNDHLAVANVLNNLASLYVYQGLYEKAESTQQRALTIRERHLPPEHPDVNMSLNNLAAIYRYLERPLDSEKLLKRAVSNTEGMGSGANAAISKFLNNLAVVYKERGAYDKAEPLYQRAIFNMEVLLGPEHPAVAPYLANLASLQYSRGQHGDALEQQRRAVSILRRRVAELSQVASEESWSEQRQLRDFFVDHVALLQAAVVAGAETEEAATAESFATAQLAMQRTAGQAVARMAARFSTGQDALAGLVRQQQDAVRRWQALDRRLLKAVSKPQGQRDEVIEARLRQELAEVEARLSSVEHRLESDFPEYAALAAPKPVSLAAAQDLLAEDELLVQVLVAKKASYLWAVRKDRTAFYKANMGRDALDASVRALRDDLDPWRRTAPERGARRLDRPVRDFDLDVAADLYQMLFGPAQGLLDDVRQIILIPDAGLQSLPLHVLVTSRPTLEPGLRPDYRLVPWLAGQYATNVLPAVASLASLRRISGATKATRPFLGIGDPLLQGDSTAQVTADPTALFARGAVADVDALRHLPRLPETADELQAIGMALGADDTSLYLGPRATESMVKAKSDLHDYKVIAFATHGLTAGEFHGLAEPALVLTPPEKGSPNDDGLLTSGEIAQLRLDADWVVLSACNTAAPDGTPGAEGLSGLARAFFYAGSRALLVSHWAVDSQATADLTTRMFAELARKPGIGRAEALRQSMLALLGDPAHPQYAHPRFWAPFVIVGDGR